MKETPAMAHPFETQVLNTIRLLAVDMVETAKAGHPGLPMGATSLAYLLWTKFMRHNPHNPSWTNRDRFILSAGHGCALLYALLHLSGYDLPMAELKRFRQWQSKTPGHPEYGHTIGVETTTGPLGQGFANGVGMAIAERHLAAYFNRPNFPLIDHFTYVLCSDGDLMEGVASEAASLAGHLKLGKLIYLYDSNGISIDGPTDLTFTENVTKRFEAYGWHIQEIDGHDHKAITAAVEAAQHETEHPSLIKANTHIGYGSPNKQDKASAHGEPLGPEEAKLVKIQFGFSPDAGFQVVPDIYDHFKQAMELGMLANHSWNNLWTTYQTTYPDLAKTYQEAMAGDHPEGWKKNLPLFPANEKLATRAASGKTLNAISPSLPLLMGGSADLTPSNNTFLKDRGVFAHHHYDGANLHFGVREHAMGAIVNGITLHKGITAYTGTFLVFSDYMRPTIRLAALMNIPSIFVFTHDSIGLGEDGPTHQPIEHLMALRAIPNITLIRPADANETAAAWRVALERKKPVVLVLTRQALPTFDPQQYPLQEGVPKGAYILSDCDGKPDLLLIATGSEVHLALEAQAVLKTKGVHARVISMPSWELFQEQPKSYQEHIFPPTLKARLAIEAGATLGWYRWIGEAGKVIGIDRFGASAPGGTVMKEYGFHSDHIVQEALSLLKA